MTKHKTTRLIRTRAELGQMPEVINMLNNIVGESERDFNLSLRFSRLQSFTPEAAAWRVNEKWLGDFESTRKSIIVAEVDGAPKAALVYMVNDQETRLNLGIPENQNFVIMIKAITKSEMRNTGVLGELVKRMQFETKDLDAAYITCVSNKVVINTETGKEFFVVMNLDRYSEMHKKTFENNYLQMRYRDSSGNQFGREKVDLRLFLNSANSIDNERINLFINRHIPEAKKENKEVMGFYLIGEGRVKWQSVIAEQRRDAQIPSRL